MLPALCDPAMVTVLSQVLAVRVCTASEAGALLMSASQLENHADIYLCWYMCRLNQHSDSQCNGRGITVT